MTIWGDNQNTLNKDGAIDGENLRVMAYDPKTHTTSNINIFELSDRISGDKITDLKFKRDGIFVARGEVITENININLTNSPNPFSGTTSINYSVPENSIGDLSIYTLDGICVSKLLSGEIKSGSTQFNSDGLASGVYSLVLRIGSQTLTQIMIIEK